MQDPKSRTIWPRCLLEAGADKAECSLTLTDKHELMWSSGICSDEDDV